MFLACATTSFNPNVKIVGGVPAIANSWPAQVFILITISGYYSVGIYGSKYVNQAYDCGGTLIDANTVLTAAHCLVETIDYNYKGQTYTLNVINPLDPTQYSVYIGAHDISFIKTGAAIPYPTVKMSVQTVIRVSKFFNTNHNINVYK